jgi:very-short-patch-repair endonuclease
MRKPPGIVTGQRIEEAKFQRSQEMRRAMTPEEDLLWQKLRRGQLNGLRFRRQQIIRGFIADFYCHAAGVVVEVDGELHTYHADYDALRDRVLSAAGVRVLRVTNHDVRECLEWVLAQISDLCAQELEA